MWRNSTRIQSKNLINYWIDEVHESTVMMALLNHKSSWNGGVALWSMCIGIFWAANVASYAGVQQGCPMTPLLLPSWQPATSMCVLFQIVKNKDKEKVSHTFKESNSNHMIWEWINIHCFFGCIKNCKSDWSQCNCV